MGKSVDILMSVAELVKFTETTCIGLKIKAVLCTSYLVKVVFQGIHTSIINYEPYVETYDI